MESELDRLARGKYLLVTTFRRNGTPVPTPVWMARDGNELLVWSARDAGKVKRIRNSGQVELAECDFNGNPSGATVAGTARLLDKAGSDRARRAISTKYGLIGRLSMFGSRLRRGTDGTVGIAITVG